MGKISENDKAILRILCTGPSGRTNRDSCLISENPVETHPYPFISVFDYINNPDGTIRWLFPAGARRPHFLAFYNNTSRRGKLYRLFFRMVYFLGLQTLITHRLYVYHGNTLYLENILQAISYRHYSVFTGTIGENRKVVVEAGDGRISTHFIKIALNTCSQALIENEKSVLRWLSAQGFQSFKLPGTIPSTKGILIQDNVATGKLKPMDYLSHDHWQMQDELLNHTKSVKALSQSSTYIYAKNDLQVAKRLEGIPADSVFRQQAEPILSGVEQLLESLNEDMPVITGIAHGDYTPWNMFRGMDMMVYDWELSTPDAPALYDLFHFIFQKGILINRLSFDQIYSQVEQLEHSTLVTSWVRKYNLNFWFHYKLYLASVISYYVKKYVAQYPGLHQQAHWLFDVWQLALLKENAVDNRHSFLSGVFVQIQHIPYVLLKHRLSSVTHLAADADLDILVSKEHASKLLEIIRCYSGARHMEIIQKSFMSVVRLEFPDHTYLNIDLIYQFKRKNLVYLHPEEILNHRRTNAEQISVPQLHHDLEYIILFYLLNHAPVPHKYIQFFESHAAELRNKALTMINKKFGFSLTNLAEINGELGKYQRMLFKTVKQYVENQFPRSISHLWNYLKDVMKSFKQHSGKVITFSGVDGAGKTTILLKVKTMIEKQYRQKVIVKRHRPSILPIISSWIYGRKKAEAISMASLPRQGGNKSRLSSMVRFAYYFLDYLLGQFFVYFRYTVFGIHIIYDRYYFDFIVDPRRSNLNINPAFARLLYRFIIKPDRNYFLYADPEQILARKKELQKEDIISLTQGYQALFTQLNDETRYQCIENISIEKTMASIDKSLAL